jgi:hypothetical protein
MVVAALLMAGCAPRAPQKPAGVPAGSFWVGDRKAGVFVVVGPKAREGWRVQIYDDRTGAVRGEGVYTLRGLARAELTQEELVSFDGHALHLADGALLVPKVQP